MSAVEIDAEELVRILLEVMGEQDRRDVLKRVAEAAPARRAERGERSRHPLAAIANGLNNDRVPTAQGGRQWYPATIRHTLNRTS